MSSMRKYAGSRFVKADDVRLAPIQAKIEVAIGKYDKPDILFEDGSKLSANATNVRILCRHYGDDSADWIGVEVELTLGEIDFQGEKKPAVIILPISPPAEKKPAEKTPFDDEIPF